MTEKRLSADQVPVAGGGSAAQFANSIISSKVVSGKSDFIALPGGLVVTVQASGPDPFVYAIDTTVVSLAANASVGVTDNANNFLWMDSLGALGFESTPPIYSYTAPGGPATGQHWFDLSKNAMNRWNGAAWIAIDHIFVGYVRADAGSINARYVCEPVGLTPLDRFLTRGTGTDGFLEVSGGVSTLDGSKNYTAVVIRGGGIVKHTAAVITQMSFAVQGIVALIGTGGFDLNDLGAPVGAQGNNNGADGGLGGAGGGGSPPGPATNGDGGSHLVPWAAPMVRGAGIASTVDNVPGTTGEDSQIPADGLREPTTFNLYGGGGGGAGNAGGTAGTGSPGGGGIQIMCSSLAIGATAIFRSNTSNGTNGINSNTGGGATGGGGVLAVFARNFWNDSASFTATPGSGGGEGGGGGGPGGVGGLGKAFWRRW